jgi:hypothetical protein
MSTIFDAHVICCNDSVEYVVLGSLMRANEKMEELARAMYERQGEAHWRDQMRYSTAKSPYAAFRDRCYWHIHTVEGEESHGITKQDLVHRQRTG